jgi:hypothetical protein
MEIGARAATRYPGVLGAAMGSIRDGMRLRGAIHADSGKRQATLFFLLAGVLVLAALPMTASAVKPAPLHHIYRTGGNGVWVHSQPIVHGALRRCVSRCRRAGGERVAGTLSCTVRQGWPRSNEQPDAVGC